jgi:hypothetical protein
MTIPSAMNLIKMRRLLFGILCCGLFFSAKAQEHVVPLRQKAVVSETLYGSKKQRVSLPFVDDFSYDSPYPDTSLWLDRMVYINNTLSAEPPTRGVATFDGLNAWGRPYFPSQFASGWADSLTSKPIDLSAYSAASQIYLSFYAQPQGLGFAPENTDSLILFFKNNNNQWEPVWRRWGTPWQPFRIETVPVTQAQFLHATFQFRFVNIASLNLNDDIWNIDYVKLDANRSVSDTAMNDAALTIPPGSILFPYTQMPYRHFTVNPNAELSTQQDFQISNLYGQSQTVTPAHTATDSGSATVINALSLLAVGIGSKSVLNQAIPSYAVTVSPPLPSSRVVLDNRYFISSLGPADLRRNDTIVRQTVFDQAFAYDDGSAEKAYFLFAANNFPAKTAMQFRLNQTDTIRGLQVFFAAQAPTAAGKYFSVVLYHHLAGSGLSDSIIMQQDLYRVQYDTNRNGFITCAFQQPVVVPAGNYYIGITQPANFGSDSIYYGLDVNTQQNTQQLFYNVEGVWYGSSSPGTIMMRMLCGPAVVSTGVETHTNPMPEAWFPYPNPCTDVLHLPAHIPYTSLQCLGMDGRQWPVNISSPNTIEMLNLPRGVYILRATNKQQRVFEARIIHQ